MSDFTFECPHCQGQVIVGQNEINCGIFRHGVYKSNLHPIHPHLPKHKCDRLVSSGLIYGCAKPFRVSVIQPNNEIKIEICDYI